jgi:hypothetical protein
MRLTRLICALAGAVLITAPVFAHRLHAGVTEITINARTQEMEIIHRLFADDLMVALGHDDTEESEFFLSDVGLNAIRAYAESQFRFADSSGLLFELSYVGAELDGEFAWIYFTAAAPDLAAGFAVDNDLLADLFDDQVMMTNLRFNDDVRTAMQGPGSRNPIRLSFD